MIVVFVLYNVLCNWRFSSLWLSLTLIKKNVTRQFKLHHLLLMSTDCFVFSRTICFLFTFNIYSYDQFILLFDLCLQLLCP